MKDLNSTQLMIYEIEEAFNRDVLKMSPEMAAETALIKVQSITRLVRLKRLS